MSREKKKGSGEHPAVVAFRKKLESIDEHTMPRLRELNERLDEISSSHPPPRDPRREPADDPRKDDDEPPIDIVIFDDDEPDTIPRKEPPPIPIGKLTPPRPAKK